MADGLLEKKHAATPRRRQQARQQGQVAVSQDLTSAALLLAAVASLWFFGGAMASQLATSISESLSAPVVSGFDIPTAAHWFLRLAGKIVLAVVPILIVMMLAGVLTSVLQTGLMVTPSRVTPKLNNISPQAGLRRILSINGAARFGFGVFKILVVVAVVYAAVRQYGGSIVNLDAMEMPQIAGTLFQSLMGTCLWIGGALFALAVVDYGFQRWKFERDLMMTDEELRQELKETAGDPQVVDRRRELARQYAASSADTNLRNPDIVLVDQDGWSIAVRYDGDKMNAPVVTAFGGGAHDSRIRDAAARQSIPVRTHRLPLLGRDSIAVGQPIPAAFYAAVARVLAANRG